MKCDHCHTNEATVHMTNIVNNQKQNNIYVRPVLINYKKMVSYLPLVLS